MWEYILALVIVSVRDDLNKDKKHHTLKIGDVNEMNAPKIIISIFMVYPRCFSKRH
jgi:hypothetical protein